MASVNTKKYTQAVIISSVLALALSAEAYFLIDSASEETKRLNIYLAGREITNEICIEIETPPYITPWADWIGLKRCQKLLEKNGTVLEPDKQTELKKIEKRTLFELNCLKKTYEALYADLNNEQIKQLLAPDPYTAPYISVGAEVLNYKTYIKAVYAIKKQAEKEPFAVKGFKNADTAVCGAEPYEGNKSIDSKREDGILLSPVNYEPLEPEQGAGFEDNEERKHLMEEVQSLQMHPLRLLLSLEDLYIRRDACRLSVSQAQKIFVLLGRLRAHSRRIYEYKRAAEQLFPQGALNSLYALKNQTPPELRRAEYIINPRALQNSEQVLQGKDLPVLHMPVPNPQMPKIEKKQRHNPPGHHNPPPPGSPQERPEQGGMQPPPPPGPPQESPEQGGMQPPPPPSLPIQDKQ